jgi:hypothetical protein
MVARQIRNECSLKQGNKKENASATNLFRIFKNALTLQGSRTIAAIQWQTARGHSVHVDLEADKAVAEMQLRRALATQ